MSITKTVAVQHGCGAHVQITLCDSINIDRHPHLRTALLAGRLHRFTCTQCFQDFVIEHELFYFDATRRHFMCVYPRRRLADAEGCAAEAMATFDRVLGSGAPPALAALAPSFLVRICFGYDELRDKVLIDEAKLSDLVVEELKAEVLASRAELRELGVVTLWLRQAGPPLEFEAESIGPQRRQQTVIVPRALYDDIAARGHEAIQAARPELVHGPHVSLLRLMTAAGPGPTP